MMDMVTARQFLAIAADEMLTRRKNYFQNSQKSLDTKMDKKKSKHIKIELKTQFYFVAF